MEGHRRHASRTKTQDQRLESHVHTKSTFICCVSCVFFDNKLDQVHVDYLPRNISAMPMHLDGFQVLVQAHKFRNESYGIGVFTSRRHQSLKIQTSD